MGNDMTEPTYPVHLTAHAWGEVAGFLLAAAEAAKEGAMILAAHDIHDQTIAAIEHGKGKS